MFSKFLRKLLIPTCIFQALSVQEGSMILGYSLACHMLLINEPWLPDKTLSRHDDCGNIYTIKILFQYKM